MVDLSGSAVCFTCGKPLEHDEIGAYKKLINRGAQAFQCKVCLAKELRVSVELIDQKIEHFRRQGCTLFLSEEALARKMGKE